MRLTRYPIFHLSPWLRRLSIGLMVALTSQIYLSLWAEGFRVSASVILYPILLITMMRDSHRPDTGLTTGLCVLLLRVAIDLAGGMALTHALSIEYPGGVFYLCYELLLCLLVRDRRTIPPLRLWSALLLCDFLSNVLNLWLSSRSTAPDGLLPLAGLALGRSLAACAILWAGRGYRQLLLRTEHEHRYRRLFLMTANLKTELYFLKKDSEDIEGVMSHAYQLYERLEKEPSSGDLTALALSIARDVHEIKKDNLRIIRGLEEDVAEAYDHEAMALSDLLDILEVSTRQFLGEQRAEVRLECRCTQDFPVREHYRLLSILKNLVTNAVEAIQSDRRRGTVQVEAQTEGDRLHLTVSDDGPGIPPRAMKMLFQVGYSTKFSEATGDISRGVGLPAVQYIVEELEGSILVEPRPGRGAVFHVELPLDAVTGGERM